MKRTETENRKLWPVMRSGLVGALIGLGIMLTPLGAPLERAGYDVLSGLQPVVEPDEILVVWLDDQSYDVAEGNRFLGLDRGIHARLVDRLNELGARLIVFDLVFSDALDEQGDAAFAEAIRKAKVILAGEKITTVTDSEEVTQVFPPLERFATNAVGWGDVMLPVDPDFAIRVLSTGEEEPFSLASKAARTLENASPRQGAWLRYYGPPGSLPTLTYSDLLTSEGDELASDVKGKVVFVGEFLQTGRPGQSKDVFLSPFRGPGNEFIPGVNVHATSYLNITRGDALKRTPRINETWLVIGLGFAFGVLLTLLPPLWGAIVYVVAAAGIAGSAHWLFHGGVYWGWLIPFVQLLAVYLIALAGTALRLHVERKLLHMERKVLQLERKTLLQSLELYLPHKLAEQVVKNPGLLKPGAKPMDISIMFTDIADFSRHAQTLGDEHLFEYLNEYFEGALNCIKERDGVMTQLNGDAILALWNAPAPTDSYQLRAAETALALQEKFNALNESSTAVPTQTRCGLHAGSAAVGNLGSKNRFIYTCQGPAVNLASRLEGLNKYLRTRILATKSIYQHCQEQFVWRRIGRFVLKGMDQREDIYELLGRGEELAAETKEWRELYEAALHQFERRRFDTAEELFWKVNNLRHREEGEAEVDLHWETVHTEFLTRANLETSRSLRKVYDGPSVYFVEWIAKHRDSMLHSGWAGEIELGDK